MGAERTARMDDAVHELLQTQNKDWQDAYDALWHRISYVREGLARLAGDARLGPGEGEESTGLHRSVASFLEDLERQPKLASPYELRTRHLSQRGDL